MNALVNTLRRVKHWLTQPWLLRLVRGLGALLTLASIALIIWRGWSDVGWERMISLGNAFVISMALYGASFGVQTLVWSRLIRQFTGASFGWRDAEIYALSNLMRNTPGVVWYLLERTEAYKKDGVTSGQTLRASSTEWALLVLASPICYGIGLALEAGWLNWVGMMLLLAIANLLTYQITSKRKAQTQRLWFWAWVMLSYAVSYILGALISYLLCHALMPNTPLSFAGALKIWALFTGFSILASVIIPLNFGVREISIAYLFKPYVELDSITLAALLRILFIICDIVFGFVLWQIARFFRSHTTHHSPS
jgi:hypothetical protein